MSTNQSIMLFICLVVGGYAVGVVCLCLVVLAELSQAWRSDRE